MSARMQILMLTTLGNLSCRRSIKIYNRPNEIFDYEQGKVREYFLDSNGNLVRLRTYLETGDTKTTLFLRNGKVHRWPGHEENELSSGWQLAAFSKLHLSGWNHTNRRGWFYEI